MKVAFISTVHGHLWPGSEYLWSGAAAILLQRGVKTTALISRDFERAEELRDLCQAGLETVFASKPNSRLRRIATKLLNPLQKLSHLSPNIYVVSSGSAFDPCFMPGLSRFLLTAPVPYIFVCHFNAEGVDVQPSQRETMKKILQKAQALVFVSEDNRRITERQLAIPLPKSQIIFPPLRVRRESPLPLVKHGDCVQFACVARLEVRWKGQDILLEALSSDIWKSRNWKLTFFGEGPDEAYIRQLVTHYGLDDRVKFAGFRRDREQIWTQMDFQVLAARGEGGPMVISEGMMCGRFAVATRCGMIPDLIEDGIDGFLCEGPTAFSFSKAMERAWQRREDWGVIGHAAFDRMRQWNPPDPSKQLLGIIDRRDKSMHETFLQY